MKTIRLPRDHEIWRKLDDQNRAIIRAKDKDHAKQLSRRGAVRVAIVVAIIGAIGSSAVASDMEWDNTTRLMRPRIVLQTETEKKGVAYFADDDGELLSFVEHASPRLTPEQRRAAIADKLASNANRKQAQAEAVGQFGKGQLQKRIEAIEAWILAQ